MFAEVATRVLADNPGLLDKDGKLLATGRTPTSDPSLLVQQANQPQTWQQMGASTLLGQAIANPVAGRLQRTCLRLPKPSVTWNG